MSYNYSNEEAMLLSRIKQGFVSILVRFQSRIGALELKCGSGFIASIEDDTVTVLTEDHVLFFPSTKKLIDDESLDVIEFYSYANNKRVKIGEKRNLLGVAFFPNPNSKTNSRVISVEFSLDKEHIANKTQIQSLSIADSISFGEKSYIIKYSDSVYEKTIYDDTLYIRANVVSGIQKDHNAFTIQDNEGTTLFSQKKDSGGPVFNSRGEILGMVCGGDHAEDLSFHVNVCDSIPIEVMNRLRQQGKQIRGDEVISENKKALNRYYDGLSLIESGNLKKAELTFQIAYKKDPSSEAILEALIITGIINKSDRERIFLRLSNISDNNIRVKPVAEAVLALESKEYNDANIIITESSKIFPNDTLLNICKICLQISLMKLNPCFYNDRPFFDGLVFNRSKFSHNLVSDSTEYMEIIQEIDNLVIHNSIEKLFLRIIFQCMNMHCIPNPNLEMFHASLAKKGEPTAQCYYALVCKDEKTAYELFCSSAKSGNNEALFHKGRILQKGIKDYLKSDKKEGFECIRQSYMNGFFAAADTLSDCYEKGIGTHKNKKRAESIMGTKRIQCTLSDRRKRNLFPYFYYPALVLVSVASTVFILFF